MFGVVAVIVIVLGLALLASSFLGKKKLNPQQVKELLNQKVVIVTGAARGLGKSLAEEFVRNGSKVVIVDLKEDLLEQTKKELIEISSPESVVALPGDLSKKEFSKEVIDATISKFGKIDILFSNHGIFPVKPIDDFSVEDIEKVLQVNFLGAVYLAKYGMEHVKKSKGTIAVTSSMAGKIAIRNSSSYCASKHALLGFFDTIRVELAAHGVQVTVICPGGMKTEMIKEAYGTYSPNDKVKFYAPEELAPGIIEAIASRKREHYTEGFLRVLGLVRALFPQTIDNFLDKY